MCVDFTTGLQGKKHSSNPGGETSSQIKNGEKFRRFPVSRPTVKEDLKDVSPPSQSGG
jgi:hypothetical protein